MKPVIEAVIVVEGKSDTQKLQQYYQVETFETSGMGLNEEILSALEELSLSKPLIVLTDPDGPGEYIRRIIMERIPSAQHLIANTSEAKSQDNKRVGIEYMNKPDLDMLFSQIATYRITDKAESVFTHRDLIMYQLIGASDSRIRRTYVEEQLHLGKVNAKQFLKRLNLFGVERNKLEEVLRKYEEQE